MQARVMILYPLFLLFKTWPYFTKASKNKSSLSSDFPVPRLSRGDKII